jgi:hypothetical protein
VTQAALSDAELAAAVQRQRDARAQQAQKQEMMQDRMRQVDP